MMRRRLPDIEKGDGDDFGIKTFFSVRLCELYTPGKQALQKKTESLFASENLGEHSERHKICCFLERPFINRMVRRDFAVLTRFFIHK